MYLHSSINLFSFIMHCLAIVHMFSPDWSFSFPWQESCLWPQDCNPSLCVIPGILIDFVAKKGLLKCVAKTNQIWPYLAFSFSFKDETRLMKGILRQETCKMWFKIEGGGNKKRPPHKNILKGKSRPKRHVPPLQPSPYTPHCPPTNNIVPSLA